MQNEKIPKNCVPEILAPAGSRESFFAALNSGADAVFLGLKQFNARARAQNFSVEDLRELVPLAHRFGMKVNVTLNILIKENERGDVIDLLAQLEDVGVNAIIVQDLGVASISRRYFPALRLHASTQMAVHNAAGVLQAHELGFKRVVLARELTAQELKKIHKLVSDTQVELEAFCHGSLCYSYSGLCFFSGAEDARSGNRGECAYTCRKPYKIINEPGHGFLFSMKDLNTVADLHLLVDAGVHTLKIEGRKKDAQYVATAVKLYRQRLNEIFGYDTLRAEAPIEAHATVAPATLQADLGLSFHRDVTSFFLKGRYHENVIDLDNPTHRGNRVGEVIKVTDDTIRVIAESSLERFDGLRLDPQSTLYHAAPQHGREYQAQDEKLQKRYSNEVPQFSLREFKIRGKQTVTAKAGDWVDISLPDGITAHVGDVVRKVRSADLRRRVDELLRLPNGVKVTPQRSVQTEVQLVEQNDSLLMKIRVSKSNQTILTEELELEKSVAQKQTSNKETLEELFGVFGNLGIVSHPCLVSVEEGWFLPRSVLKEFKRKVADRLEACYESRIRSKQEYTRAEVLKNLTAASQASEAHFSIKFDRLEYLEAFAKFRASIAELVFEPKRAFLATLDGDEISARLHTFSKDTGIAMRVAFPTVIRAWDEPLLKRWFSAFARSGITSWEIGNLGAIDLLRTWNLPCHELSSDFTLYALNSNASQQISALGIQCVTLSIEDDCKNLEDQLLHWDHSKATPQIILYKDTPLFIAESCSLTALHNGCPTSEVCGYRTLEIENEQGERFFVAHESCKSIVYDKNAYSISQHLHTLKSWGISRFRVDFLTRFYLPEQIETILACCLSGAAIAQTHSSNYARTLL